MPSVVPFRDTDRSMDPPALTATVPAEPEDAPLLAPVTRDLSWAAIHGMSQQLVRGPHGARAIMDIRRTATIRTGARMIKLLTPRQVSAYLFGRRPNGFCYRSSDLTDLRGADLAMLLGDTTYPGLHTEGEVFGLRWRAVHPSDYEIPFAVDDGDVRGYGGLGEISPHHRVGPPVLGTGFAPSQHHLIPEFVTTDLADLPVPAGASLVAFAPDGTEISLYLYVPEQRAWTRMFGPQHRHLVAGIPEISTEQEYVQMSVDHSGGSALIGQYAGRTYEALADPPHEYRVLARARAARYPVESVARRIRSAQWHGIVCTVVRVEGDWLRLRLCRPDRDIAAMSGAQVVERAIYEVWAPASEVGRVHDIDVAYPLTLPEAPTQDPQWTSD